MNLSSIPRNRIIFIGAAILAIIALIVAFMFFSRPDPRANAITLSFWGTEPQEAWNGVFTAYKAARPNVTILYTGVEKGRYDRELLTAFATGKGPDVFMIGNRDLLSRLPLLASSTRVVPSELAAVFPPAVADSFVYDGKVYALPLSLDTLALYYDRTKFDRAGIATPPVTWEEMRSVLPRLRALDDEGGLATAGLAIGGSEKTVENASDIISLLMLQNGARMANESGQAVFSGSDGKGREALRFYLDFGNAASPVYTWNEGMPKSTEAFAAGKAAAVFLYHEDAKTLVSKNPFLAPAVAPALQVNASQGVNVARFEGLAAWIGSQKADPAWDFILFATTNTEAARAYMEAADRPPALRTLIAEAAKRPELSVFARQALTARSWLAPDYAKVKETMSGVIEDYFEGKIDAMKAVAEMQNRINQIPR